MARKNQALIEAQEEIKRLEKECNTIAENHKETVKESVANSVAIYKKQLLNYVELVSVIQVTAKLAEWIEKRIVEVEEGTSELLKEEDTHG